MKAAQYDFACYLSHLDIEFYYNESELLYVEVYMYKDDYEEEYKRPAYDVPVKLMLSEVTSVEFLHKTAKHYFRGEMFDVKYLAIEFTTPGDKLTIPFKSLYAMKGFSDYNLNLDMVELILDHPDRKFDLFLYI